MQPQVKLAIITDVHADPDALEDALRQIDRLGCAQIVCAGDLIDWGEFPERTIAILRERKIPCVRGNHDRWAASAGRDQDGNELTARTVDFLASLPTHLELLIEGVRILVWHARPGSDMKGIEYNTERGELNEIVNRAQVDVLVVGHTHRPFCRRLGGGRWVVNPGALLREPSSRTSGALRSGTFGVLELPARRFTVRRAHDGTVVELAEN